jgi:hypothetical protein
MPQNADVSAGTEGLYTGDHLSVTPIRIPMSYEQATWQPGLLMHVDPGVHSEVVRGCIGTSDNSLSEEIDIAMSKRDKLEADMTDDALPYACNWRKINESKFSVQGSSPADINKDSGHNYRMHGRPADGIPLDRALLKNEVHHSDMMYVYNTSNPEGLTGESSGEDCGADTVCYTETANHLIGGFPVGVTEVHLLARAVTEEGRSRGVGVILQDIFVSCIAGQSEREGFENVSVYRRAVVPPLRSLQATGATIDAVESYCASLGVAQVKLHSTRQGLRSYMRHGCVPEDSQLLVESERTAMAQYLLGICLRGAARYGGDALDRVADIRYSSELATSAMVLGMTRNFSYNGDADADAGGGGAVSGGAAVKAAVGLPKRLVDADKCALTAREGRELARVHARLAAADAKYGTRVAAHFVGMLHRRVVVPTFEACGETAAQKRAAAKRRAAAEKRAAAEAKAALQKAEDHRMVGVVCAAIDTVLGNIATATEDDPNGMGVRLIKRNGVVTKVFCLQLFAGTPTNLRLIRIAPAASVVTTEDDFSTLEDRWTQACSPQQTESGMPAFSLSVNHHTKQNVRRCYSLIADYGNSPRPPPANDDFFANKVATTNAGRLAKRAINWKEYGPTPESIQDDKNPLLLFLANGEILQHTPTTAYQTAEKEDAAEKAAAADPGAAAEAAAAAAATVFSPGYLMVGKLAGQTVVKLNNTAPHDTVGFYEQFFARSKARLQPELTKSAKTNAQETEQSLGPVALGVPVASVSHTELKTFGFESRTFKDLVAEVDGFVVVGVNEHEAQLQIVATLTATLVAANDDDDTMAWFRTVWLDSMLLQEHDKAYLATMEVEERPGGNNISAKEYNKNENAWIKAAKNPRLSLLLFSNGYTDVFDTTYSGSRDTMRYADFVPDKEYETVSTRVTGLYTHAVELRYMLEVDETLERFFGQPPVNNQNVEIPACKKLSVNQRFDAVYNLGGFEALERDEKQQRATAIATALYHQCRLLTGMLQPGRWLAARAGLPVARRARTAMVYTCYVAAKVDDADNAPVLDTLKWLDDTFLPQTPSTEFETRVKAKYTAAWEAANLSEDSDSEVAIPALCLFSFLPLDPDADMKAALVAFGFSDVRDIQAAGVERLAVEVAAYRLASNRSDRSSVFPTIDNVDSEAAFFDKQMETYNAEMTAHTENVEIYATLTEAQKQQTDTPVAPVAPVAPVPPVRRRDINTMQYPEQLVQICTDNGTYKKAAMKTREMSVSVLALTDKTLEKEVEEPSHIFVSGFMALPDKTFKMEARVEKLRNFYNASLQTLTDSMGAPNSFRSSPESTVAPGTERVWKTSSGAVSTFKDSDKRLGLLLAAQQIYDDVIVCASATSVDDETMVRDLVSKPLDVLEEICAYANVSDEKRTTSIKHDLVVAICLTQVDASLLLYAELSAEKFGFTADQVSAGMVDGGDWIKAFTSYLSVLGLPIETNFNDKTVEEALRFVDEKQLVLGAEAFVTTSIVTDAASMNQQRDALSAVMRSVAALNAAVIRRQIVLVGRLGSYVLPGIAGDPDDTDRRDEAWFGAERTFFETLSSLDAALRAALETRDRTKETFDALEGNIPVDALKERITVEFSMHKSMRSDEMVAQMCKRVGCIPFELIANAQSESDDPNVLTTAPAGEIPLYTVTVKCGEFTYSYADEEQVPSALVANLKSANGRFRELYEQFLEMSVQKGFVDTGSMRVLYSDVNPFRVGNTVRSTLYTEVVDLLDSLERDPKGQKRVIAERTAALIAGATGRALQLAKETADLATVALRRTARDAMATLWTARISMEAAVTANEASESIMEKKNRVETAMEEVETADKAEQEGVAKSKSAEGDWEEALKTVEVAELDRIRVAKKVTNLAVSLGACTDTAVYGLLWHETDMAGYTLSSIAFETGYECALSDRLEVRHSLLTETLDNAGGPSVYSAVYIDLLWSGLSNAQMEESVYSRHMTDTQTRNRVENVRVEPDTKHDVNKTLQNFKDIYIPAARLSTLRMREFVVQYEVKAIGANIQLCTNDDSWVESIAANGARETLVEKYEQFCIDMDELLNNELAFYKRDYDTNEVPQATEVPCHITFASWEGTIAALENLDSSGSVQEEESWPRFVSQMDRVVQMQSVTSEDQTTSTLALYSRVRNPGAVGAIRRADFDRWWTAYEEPTVATAASLSVNSSVVLALRKILDPKNLGPYQLYHGRKGAPLDNRNEFISILKETMHEAELVENNGDSFFYGTDFRHQFHTLYRQVKKSKDLKALQEMSDELEKILQAKEAKLSAADATSEQTVGTFVRTAAYLRCQYEAEKRYISFESVDLTDMDVTVDVEKKDQRARVIADALKWAQWQWRRNDNFFAAAPTGDNNYESAINFEYRRWIGRSGTQKASKTYCSGPLAYTSAMCVSGDTLRGDDAHIVFQTGSFPTAATKLNRLIAIEANETAGNLNVALAHSKLWGGRIPKYAAQVEPEAVSGRGGTRSSTRAVTVSPSGQPPRSQIVAHSSPWLRRDIFGPPRAKSMDPPWPPFVEPQKRHMLGGRWMVLPGSDKRSLARVVCCASTMGLPKKAYETSADAHHHVVEMRPTGGGDVELRVAKGRRYKPPAETLCIKVMHTAPNDALPIEEMVAFSLHDDESLSTPPLVLSIQRRPPAPGVPAAAAAAASPFPREREVAVSMAVAMDWARLYGATEIYFSFEPPADDPADAALAAHMAYRQHVVQAVRNGVYDGLKNVTFGLFKPGAPKPGAPKPGAPKPGHGTFESTNVRYGTVADYIVPDVSLRACQSFLTSSAHATPYDPDGSSEKYKPNVHTDYDPLKFVRLYAEMPNFSQSFEEYKTTHLAFSETDNSELLWKWNLRRNHAARESTSGVTADIRAVMNYLVEGKTKDRQGGEYLNPHFGDTAPATAEYSSSVDIDVLPRVMRRVFAMATSQSRATRPSSGAGSSFVLQMSESFQRVAPPNGQDLLLSGDRDSGCGGLYNMYGEMFETQFTEAYEPSGPKESNGGFAWYHYLPSIAVQSGVWFSLTAIVDPAVHNSIPGVNGWQPHAYHDESYNVEGSDLKKTTEAYYGNRPVQPTGTVAGGRGGLLLTVERVLVDHFAATGRADVLMQEVNMLVAGSQTTKVVDHGLMHIALEMAKAMVDRNEGCLASFWPDSMRIMYLSSSGVSVGANELTTLEGWLRALARLRAECAAQFLTDHHEHMYGEKWPERKVLLANFVRHAYGVEVAWLPSLLQPEPTPVANTVATQFETDYTEMAADLDERDKIAGGLRTEFAQPEAETEDSVSVTEALAQQTRLAARSMVLLVDSSKNDFRDLRAAVSALLADTAVACVANPETDTAGSAKLQLFPTDFVPLAGVAVKETDTAHNGGFYVAYDDAGGWSQQADGAADEAAGGADGGADGGAADGSDSEEFNPYDDQEVTDLFGSLRLSDAQYASRC